MASGRCEHRSAEKAEKLLQTARARLPQAAGSSCGVTSARAVKLQGPSAPHSDTPPLCSSWVLCTPPLTFPGAPPEGRGPSCACVPRPAPPILQPRGRLTGLPGYQRPESARAVVASGARPGHRQGRCCRSWKGRPPACTGSCGGPTLCPWTWELTKASRMWEVSGRYA